MEKTILELQTKVESYREEARFWKSTAGVLVMTFTLLVVFLSGAMRLADGEACRGREEQPERQRFTDEVLKGGNVILR
jgi:hypothetical protein